MQQQRQQQQQVHSTNGQSPTSLPTGERVDKVARAHELDLSAICVQWPPGKFNRLPERRDGELVGE